jgi:predicted NUDIX family phosphoesterase
MDDARDELVLGVSRADLLEAGAFGAELWMGMLADDPATWIDLIARAGWFRPRAEAESDPSWKQVIPYLLLRDGERLFLMHRTRAGGDVRLHDRWSIGIGGHVNPGDGDVLGGLRREWAEEVTADWDPQPRFVGLLNDDSTPVGQVHLGLVYDVEAYGRSVAIRETNKLQGEFATLREARRVRSQMESWSQLLLDHLDGRAGMG